MKTYKIKKKYNYKNIYLLVITAIAVVSLVGNFFQDRYYKLALTIQEDTIEELTYSQTTYTSNLSLNE